MRSRFFTCSVPRCKRANVRSAGGCDVCGRYLCHVHLCTSFHKCNNTLDDETYKQRVTAEIERLRSRTDDKSICTYASSLNGGRGCDIEHYPKVGTSALTGSANYHARIRFHDGSPSWLLRVPRVTSVAASAPSFFVNYLVLSEYATLKFLETTPVPAPRAFGYGIYGGEDHGAGVSFILMEELPGVPWTGQGVSGGKASENEKTKIWSGLADILTHLSKYPFQQAGSLLCQSSEVEVAAVASDRFVVLSPTGPFNTTEAYYTAFIEQHLELIADGQLYTEYPVEAYLVYRFLKDNVSQLVAKEHRSTESFYLKHVDDKGDHLLVDEDLNITGIIDWQMARVVPPLEAFGPSLVTANMSDLCNGRVSLSPDDLILADMLEKRKVHTEASRATDEKVRRLFWGLSLESEWRYALPLANAILQVFGVGVDWSKWKEDALKMYKTDERLGILLGRR